jgi:hypothetical protein
MTDSNSDQEPSFNLKIEAYDHATEVNVRKEDRNLVAWEKIGFQRQLGGWMYGFSISIFSMIVGIITIGFITGLLYPFPEQRGYMRASGILFAVVYQIFDIGTAFGIRRFIAEYRVKSPQKMLEYIRFFIWYQMMTGIIQVLVISIIILRVVRTSELAYLSWIMLIACQKQWPGMLGTFKSVIDGLQHHNKTHILNFINGEIFQQMTNIIFILIFRRWGAQNPQYGELMGAVIGMAIGGYVDDFFAMALSAYFYNRIMKPFGITFRESWRFEFDKDVIRNCLYYGAQVSIVPIINGFVGTAIGLIYLTYIPQYTTWGSIAELGGSIAGIVSVWDFNLNSSIAESYPNGKIKLSQFYISYAFKWQNFLAMLYLEIILSFLPIVIFFINNTKGLENYQLATVFILPMIIPKLFGPIFNIPGDVMNGALHITFDTITRLIQTGCQFFFVWLFVIKLQLHITYGLEGLIFIFAFDGFFPNAIRTIIGWIYVKHRIFPIKLYWMTSIILPILAGIPIYIFSTFWTNLVFFPLVDLLTLLPAVIITVILGVFCVPFFGYLPMTGIIGAWDDFQLYTFKKAVEISGPSRLFFVPFYWAVEFGVNIGRKLKLHNRFKIPWEDAEREMIELNQMKIDAKYVPKQKILDKRAPWLGKKQK